MVKSKKTTRATDPKLSIEQQKPRDAVEPGSEPRGFRFVGMYALGEMVKSVVLLAKPRCVISELRLLQSENERLRGDLDRRTSTIRRLESEIIEQEKVIIALQQTRDEEPELGLREISN